MKIREQLNWADGLGFAVSTAVLATFCVRQMLMLRHAKTLLSCSHLTDLTAIMPMSVPSWQARKTLFQACVVVLVALEGSPQAEEWWKEGAERAMRDAYRTARAEDIADVTAWCRAIFLKMSTEEKLASLARVEEGGSRNDPRQVSLAMARYELLVELDRKRADTVCQLTTEDELIRKVRH